jgi:hypothetical protein
LARSVITERQNSPPFDATESDKRHTAAGLNERTRLVNVNHRRSQTRSSVKRAGRIFLTALLLLLLIGHYTIVSISLLPSNAITILWGRFIDSYMDPFFLQNWDMFAPAPAQSNETFLIQLRLSRDREGGTFLTKWIDLTSSLKRKAGLNPLSSEILRLRTIEGIILLYRNYVVRETSNPSYVPSISDSHAATIYQSLLVALASDLHITPTYKIVALRGRIVFDDIPPFSDLQNAHRTEVLRTLTFDWTGAETVSP